MIKPTIAMISADEVQSANDALEAEGHGPGNFSIPASSDGTDPATHYLLSWWNMPDLTTMKSQYSTLKVYGNPKLTLSDVLDQEGLKRIKINEL